MNKKRLRVGAAQIAPLFLDKHKNLLKIEEFLEKASQKNITVTVFPECALTGYAFSSLQEVQENAEPIPGFSTRKIETICKRLNCWMIIGLIEVDNANFFNTAVLIGPRGIAAKHRKVHLPHQGFDKYATGGEGPLKIYKTLLGNIGLVVCYDLFFPETLRVLNLLGVELVAVPTNWAEGVEFYVDHLIQTRAIENHINIVAANRTGQEKQFTFYGRSCIVDYNGKILAEAGREEELIMAEVDMDKPHKKHIIRIPGEWETHKLRDRRPDLYKTLTAR